MCAIISWAGRTKRGQWRQVHGLLTEMLVASACRGTDATGFAALDRQGRLITDKAPVQSRTFIRVSPSWGRLSYPSCVVAHCRAATHGSPHNGDNRNNHPFTNDRLAVVVNGVAPNYLSVAATHGVRLTSECDSEVVLRLLAGAEDVPEGLRACLRELNGGLAAAVLDSPRRSVWLARNEGRPAWLLRLAGVNGWFACSTREIAEETVRRTYGRPGLRQVEYLAPLAADVPIEMTGTGKVMAAPAVRFPPRSITRGLRFD